MCIEWCTNPGWWQLIAIVVQTVVIVLLYTRVEKIKKTGEEFKEYHKEAFDRLHQEIKGIREAQKKKDKG